MLADFAIWKFEVLVPSGYRVDERFHFGEDTLLELEVFGCGLHDEPDARPAISSSFA